VRCTTRTWTNCNGTVNPQVRPIPAVLIHSDLIFGRDASSGQGPTGTRSPSREKGSPPSRTFEVTASSRRVPSPIPVSLRWRSVPRRLVDVWPDEFDQVRAEADPLRQARRAAELLAVYQQRSIELARLRRDAINRAAQERGMSLPAVAQAVGLSKGRITQIRQSAPATERAFFGVGPITIAIPERIVPGRSLPVLPAEDTQSAQLLGELLRGLQFQVHSTQVPAVGEWHPPRGDLIAICGPKSSPTIAEVLTNDPLLDFGQDETGCYRITDRATGKVWTSGHDAEPSRAEDVAYVGRMTRDGRSLLVIAGVHAIGSLGAVRWLTENLDELHRAVGERPFSMVVRTAHHGLTITESELVCPPRAF
jgi:hypothetical protein